MVRSERLTPRIVHPAIDARVDGLSGYLWWAVGAVVGFAVVNTALTVGYIVAIAGGSPDVSFGVRFLASGISLFVPMAILWWWIDARDRPVAFPFRFPSATEVGTALVFVPLGLVAFALGITAAATLGFEYQPFAYDLTDPVTAAGVLVGPLLLAPVVEEAVVRGLLLGSLIDRGWPPVVAGLVAILVFAAPHVWLGGAGAVGIAAWAVFPTILRLRFDNLTGAALLHFLNNVLAYVVFVAVSF